MAVTADQLIGQFKNLLSIVDAERERDMLLITKDARALIAHRIQNGGKDANEQPLPAYSDAGVPAYLYFNKEKPSGAKVGNDVDKLDEAAGPLVSYKEFRDFYQLPTNITNTTFTGEMWNNTGVEVTDKTIDIIEVSIKGLTDSAEDKLAWNSARYGNLLALSNEESALIRASAVERRAKQINRALR